MCPDYVCGVRLGRFEGSMTSRTSMELFGGRNGPPLSRDYFLSTFSARSIILPMSTWPEPRPCKRKWGRVPFDQMLRHIREDHCEQCKAVVRYFDREAALELYLRQSRN